MALSKQGLIDDNAQHRERDVRNHKIKGKDTIINQNGVTKKGEL